MPCQLLRSFFRKKCLRSVAEIAALGLIACEVIHVAIYLLAHCLDASMARHPAYNGLLVRYIRFTQNGIKINEYRIFVFTEKLQAFYGALGVSKYNVF